VYEVLIKGRLRVRINRAYYTSTVQFFPPWRRPVRAAGVDDGSLSAPCAVVAPSSGSLAPICSDICRSIAMSAVVSANRLKATRRDKSTSTLHFTLQQGAIASAALLDKVFALLDAYLARRWAICFYIKSTGFDVEFRFDVGLHQII
jgi:hypothetical protein